MTTATLRLQLRKAGYHPLPCEGKIPPLPGWPNKLSVGDDEIRLWDKAWHLARNTGVLAKFTPGLDIDIMDVAAAEAVEALAREHFEKRGSIRIRIGLPPKRLIPLRTDEPFSKLVRVFTAPNGHEHKIEVLGDGQQWIAHGIHPTTGLPYAWHGGELETTAREDLPYVRREDMEKFLDEATKLLVEDFGFVLQGGTQDATNGGERHHAAADTAWGQLNERALANLDKWVPKLFPSAKRTRKGGYRVPSADLGRGLEEDLSLTPNGIKYFGVADMGDPRQGRRTPIDIVMEWEHLEFGPATLWLLETLDEQTTETQATALETLSEQPKAQQSESPEADEEQQAKGPTPPQVLPPPTAPMTVAREFVRHCCCIHNGADLTLRYWNGGWWTWRTTHWSEVQERAVRSLLYAFTEGALYIDDKRVAKPWSPTRKKIGDLLEALSALVILSNDIETPCWIDGREMDNPIVAVTNGLLDISSKELRAHTPLYFNQTSVPFNYNPKAPLPQKWLAFLDELWPQEPTAIDVLSEWFGYVISGRLDLHKILLTVGPTRGGKGVIARILTALIGRRNVCGPTLNSLGGDFGLAPLLGKSLAVISDARFVGKNGGVVVERLLSISGEDTLTVNIKYREQWNGKLSCRLHVISNELPRLGDASTAIVGRFVLLPLSRSWLGKENHGLEAELCAELTGILNWSLDGLERLTFTNGNRFTRVAAADEAITTMRDLASPVGAFVRECCVVSPFNDDGTNREIGVDDLYVAYKSWCEGSEHPKSPKAVFGRDLRAVASSVRKIRPRAESRKHVYAGISLRTATDDAKAEAREPEMPL
jgi:putative DNA primase/helicase